MKILIVGGCFTTQGNIAAGGLYHQTLKNKLEDSGFQHVGVEILRYERIAKTLGKINAAYQADKFDVLIFHLRAEPLMRMVKFYYKYINNHKKLSYSLNIPFLRIMNPEKIDVLENRRISFDGTKEKETKLRYFLRELNYELGSAIGNKKFALSSYVRFIKEIAEYCKTKGIVFLLLGPVSRPFSRFENSLSYEMSLRFKNLSVLENIHYLELIGETTANLKPMFFPNGQHVSQEGHDEIAWKILRKMIACYY